MMNKQEIEKAIKCLEDNYVSIEDWKSFKNVCIFALTQQLNNGWIPISKRWPDKSGHYLVTYHEWTDGKYLPKYDEVYVKILRYQDAIFRLPVCIDKKAEQDTHREVLAWQTLPEPYKEVSE